MGGITRRQFLGGAAAGTALLGLGRTPLFARQDDWFSIVALPDTQYYSQSYPEIFTDQTNWIRRNVEAWRIAMVLHEGDITNKNNAGQWRNAEASLGLLDGVVPYALAVGNHDMGSGGSAKNRDTRLFRKSFPLERLSSQRGWGGCFEDAHENTFYTFTAGGMEFLVVTLEFGPRDEVLAWANDVVTQHPRHRAMMVTHAYMSCDDQRVHDIPASPRRYGCGGNDGEEQWEKFGRRHPNLFLVLSGHVLGDGLGRRVDAAEDGHPVHQVLANYQMKENGGNGWMRILRFHPALDRVEFFTWSPYLEKSAVDADNRFAIDYDMG